MIRPRIIRRGLLDPDRLLLRHLLLHHLANNAGQLGDGLVLVSRIEYLSGNKPGRRAQQLDVELADIVDVNVGPLLVPSKDSYLASVNRVIGQDIDRQIEPHPRRISADGRGPYDDGREFRRLMTKQEGFTKAFVLVVIGQRHQRVVFGHVRRVADAINRAAGDVDEALHARQFAGLHQRLETFVIDGTAQRRIEIEAGIIGNAGHVNDIRHPVEAPGIQFGVANVAADNLQIRMARQRLRAEQHQIVNHNLATRFEQLRHQHATFVSRTASD